MSWKANLSRQTNGLELVGAVRNNGSGVAALLEVARHFRGKRTGCTLRLVAFTNEEPPHFMTGTMGSMVHAKGCRRRGERIAVMISLETIGYYSSANGSQRFPLPGLGLRYSKDKKELRDRQLPLLGLPSFTSTDLDGNATYIGPDGSLTPVSTLDEILNAAVAAGGYQGDPSSATPVPYRDDDVDFDKVTGRARFGADATAPGMLWGAVKRSPHAHARIVKIDKPTVRVGYELQEIVGTETRAEPARRVEQVELADLPSGLAGAD